MQRKFGVAAITIGFLLTSTACSVTSGSSSGGSGGGIGAGLTPASRIVTLAQDGSIPDQNFLTSGTRGNFSNVTSDGTSLNGFAYQYGRVSGSNQFLGVAGVAPTTDPGDAPDTATAKYTGDYALTLIDRGRVRNEQGEISLDADFVAGTLEGEAGGLEVDGTITGQTVGGSATFRNVEANMQGVIGSERAVTAFAGNTNGAVLVGGINADIDPDD